MHPLDFSAPSPLGPQGVHALFEAQAHRSPQALALCWSGEQLSYAELDARANGLAHWLRAQGVGTDVPVALALERSFEMVIALLAVLKAGGAYVPLDPAYPAQRLAFMLQDCGAQLLLTQTHLAQRLPQPAGLRLLCLDVPDHLPAPRPDAPATTVAPQDLAYVIYTSGSTGQPKGVAMPHGPLRHLLDWQQHSLCASGMAGLRTLQYTSLSFDVSCQEILGTLAEGGTLHLIDEYERRDQHALLAFIQAQRIERLFLPFIALDGLCEAAMRQGVVPSALRLVITAGEQLRISPALVWLFERLGAELHNHYGPSETHVVSAWCLRPPAADWPTLPPIGQALPHATLRVLGEQGQRLPPGEAGELHIGGACLARGYLNQPQLSAERFIADAWAPGERLYRSGDWVRQRADGALEFLGRADQQLKIRGFRVELGEVEAVLATHPAVREVAVIPSHARAPGSAQALWAYVTPAPGSLPSSADLHDFLRQRLPAYMLPSAYQVLQALPRTASGKIDRRALPDPDLATPTAQAQDCATAAPNPATDALQAQLLQAWQSVLGQASVGLETDFFAAGGDSLSAARLRARLQTQLGRHIALRQIFEAPTVALLAQQLRTQETQTIRAYTAQDIPLTPRDAPPPMSFAQHGLWFAHQLMGASAVYNVPICVHLQGVLDVVALQTALTHIVQRHEVLRTRLGLHQGQPVQWIEPEPSTPVPLPLTDIRAHPEPAAQAQRWQQEHACRLFQLAQDLPLRLALLRQSETQWTLLLTIHHCMVDGGSIGVLLRELGVLYPAALAGQANPLPPLALQYADFAQWQRQWLRGERHQTELSYWLHQLQEAPHTLELPTDYPRPPQPSHRGATLNLLLEPALLAQVQQRAREEGATLFMLLLAIWGALLGRYGGQTDVLIGSPVASRAHPALEPLIGLFVNTLVLRIDLSGQPSLRTLLGRVRHTCLEAHAHADLPFEHLVEALHVTRNLSRAPLCQAMFVLQNNPQPPLQTPDLQGYADEIPTGTAKMDVLLNATERADGLHLRLEYALDVFAASSMQRLAGHLRNLLCAALQTPDQALNTLPCLSQAELGQLQRWNATARPLAAQNVHALFASQAATHPHATALRLQGQTLSYAELDARANGLAHWLRAQGVSTDVPVALALERSFEMVIALLAVLKAGGAYVPLDPAYPTQRLAFMLQDCGAQLLLTQTHLAQRLPQPAGLRLLCLDVPGHLPAPRPDAPATAVAPQDLAYVIYTSGSTGQPKGVAVPHQAVLRLVRETEVIHVTPDDVFLQLAPTSFDAATLEIWGALLNGASLALFPPGPPTPQALGAFLQAERISVAWLTAALFHLMVDTQLHALAGVRQLLAGGDVLSPSHVRRLLAVLPAGHVLSNGYGPTENTTFTCCHPMRAGDAPTLAIPIGRPIANTQVWVLDEQLQPLPIGVAGELYIGGLGLARGYLNQPQLTAQRFVPHPFAAGQRLYRSGDRARWRADGSLDFLGRLDQQIKIRGFRIEPGEIEAALCQHASVRQAAVLAHTPPTGERQLVAYIVAPQTQAISAHAATPDTPDTPTLREHLRTRLPDYMLPAAFVWLDALPITPNGKLDRRALPEPPQAEPAEPQDAPAVRTLLAQRLLALWRQALQQPQLGLHDNFFSMGGHSLIAARLSVDIEALVGRKVPIAMFFSAQTVADFAEQLTLENNAPPWSSLVPLQPTGTRAPLFFLHGWGGDVYAFVTIAQALAPDQPVYGLQAVGLDGRAPRHNSLPEMAAHYSAQIRALCPQGPCHLVGYSLGGWIAYATADALLRQGVPVGQVVLLDTHASAHIKPWLRWLQQTRHWAQRASHRAWCWLRPPASAHAHRNHAGSAHPEASTAQEQAQASEEHYVALHRHYRPPRLPVRVQLITTQATPAYQFWFWRHYARQGVRLHRLFQEHFDFVKPHNSACLAALLRQLLSEPESAQTPKTPKAPKTPKTAP